MLVIFLGAPGTGKGTIAKELVLNENFVHLSTGDLMRNTIKSKSELGLKLEKILAAGQLVDDDLTNEILVDGLKSFDIKNKQIILDGYPRSIPQAEFLKKYVEENNYQLKKAILFDMDEKELISRLTGRLICKKCGASYHKISVKPKVENVCDYCGSELIQRDDDKEDKIKVRLQEYEKNTKPLINFYEKENLIYKIDSTHNRKQIIEEIIKTLKA